MAIVLSIMIVHIRRKKQPLYRQKLPKVSYPKGFIESVQISYEVTRDIRGMLKLLESKWSGGTSKRISAALDYLEHSRYRDYETALYEYLSDGSDELEKLLDEVLEKEIRKQKGLICKSKDGFL